MTSGEGSAPAGASSSGAWTLVGVVWLGLLGGITTWLLVTPPGALREQLKAGQFWSLEAGLFACVVAGVYLVGELRSRFDRGDGARMTALVALSLALTLLVVPRTNRIFYDEQIYQGVGQNLADLRLAQVCNDGIMEYRRLQCWSGEYNKQPYAYPHLLSVFYRALGAVNWLAFAVNAAAMAISVCAIYVLTHVLFADRDAATFGGLLFALMPEQLMWSATAAVEPTASCALVVALVSAACYTHSRSTSALMATAVTTAYALQFRPESLLILPIVAWLVWPEVREETARPRFFWAAAIFLGLTALHIGHLVAIRDLPWGTSGARFSLDYLLGNLRVNGWFYLWDERFPVLVTILAIIGLAVRGFARSRAAMAGYFSIFFGIDLLFYAGSYNYGADVRYSLMTFPPLAVLGGLGAARVVRFASGWQRGVPVRGLAVVVVLFQFLWYAPVVRATPEEAWAARADVQAAREFARDLPPHSYVLTHNPGMFQLWGISAGQMSRAADNPSYARFLAARFGGGLYVHWNFWCNVQEAVQPEFCRRTLLLGPSDLVREQRERDQRFALYRLKMPPD